MSESNIIFYTTPNGQVNVQVQYEEESFWLTQKRMAELFGVESHTINYHLKEIYQSGDLQADPTTRKIRVVGQEGQRSVSRELDFYNLDAIITIGYRVNSYQAPLSGAGRISPTTHFSANRRDFSGRFANSRLGSPH